MRILTILGGLLAALSLLVLAPVMLLTSLVTVLVFWAAPRSPRPRVYGELAALDGAPVRARPRRLAAVARSALLAAGFLALAGAGVRLAATDASAPTQLAENAALTP